MIEDKITRDKKLRLECIIQANIFFKDSERTVENILKTAELFETYIKEKSND